MATAKAESMALWEFHPPTTCREQGLSLSAGSTLAGVCGCSVVTATIRQERRGLNDLWEFNTSTKTWTWMSGGNTVPAANGGQSGVYGTQGTPSTANFPGCMRLIIRVWSRQ